MTFPSGNRSLHLLHKYDHVQTHDVGDEPSYKLEHLDTDERQAEFIGAPEADISGYAAYDTYEASTGPWHGSPHQTLSGRDSATVTHKRISRKPLPTASVNRVSAEDSSAVKEQHSSRQHFRKSLLRIWWMESVCCVLVLLSVLAMVATVYAYNNKPLPSWKYGISISSLLAIYAIIFRASAGYILSEGLGQLKWTLFKSPRPLHDLHIYDESARGPLGCLQLLSSFRGAQVAGRLGAIATLTMLILDPFTQQLLGYKSCNVPATSFPAQDSTASLPLLPRTSAFYGNGSLLWTGWLWPEINMQAAANAGLYTVNATQVKATCATGNCTFSSSSLFKTVGYCHQCLDVTSQLIIVRNTSNLTFAADQGENGTVTRNFTSITLQQPALEGSVNTLSVNSSTTEIAMVSAAFETNSDDALFHQNYTYTFIIPASDVDSENWAFDTGGTRATQCNLFMCVRTVNSSVTYGTLQEETVAKYSNWGDVSIPGNTSRSMLDLSQLHDTQKSFLSDNGYQFTADDVMIPYNGSLRPDGVVVPGNQNLSSPDRDVTGNLGNPFLSTIPTNAIYTMSAMYSDGLQQFFKQLFTGQLVGPDADGSDRGSAVLNNLYYRGGTLASFDEAMSNIADAVTSYMRQTTVANFSTPVSGVEYVTTACVEPVWPWLTYIVAVAIMVIGFFVMMVLETGVGQDSWRHDFKSSGLATTCAGIDEQVRRRLVEALHSGDSLQLQSAARQIPVRLVRDDVKFIHQD